MINTTINWIKSHPLYAFIGAVILAFLILGAINGFGNTVERIRGKFFDNKQAAYEKQIADLKVEREAAIKRANDAEAKALLKEAESKELRDLIAAKGGQIEAHAKELEEKIEEAKKGSGNCAASPDPHGCLCAKLKALGFECN